MQAQAITAPTSLDGNTSLARRSMAPPAPVVPVTQAQATAYPLDTRYLEMAHNRVPTSIAARPLALIKSVSARKFFEGGLESNTNPGESSAVPRWFVDLRAEGRIRITCLIDATIYLRSDGRLYHVGKCYGWPPEPVIAAFEHIHEAEDFIQKVFSTEKNAHDIWECCEYLPDPECDRLDSIWRVGAAAWRTGRFFYATKRKIAISHLESSSTGVPWLYAERFDQFTADYEARYKERLERIARERAERDRSQRVSAKTYRFDSRYILSQSEERVNHFEVLGIHKHAGPREIKQAYWRLARACHPDLHPGDKDLENRFKAISHSYAELINRYA